MMHIAMEHKRYDIINQNLSRTPGRDADDPNEEILFQKVYMTGLEYSIYYHDWRMAILFYIHSADPVYNCFDGRIIEDVGTHNMHHASENDGIPIAGFKGLYCLLNPKNNVAEYNTILSSLWLMEQCHNERQTRHVDSQNVISYAKYSMCLIGAKEVWNYEFCNKIYTILQSLQRAASDAGCWMISNDICLNVLDYVMDDVLSFAIWRGLMYAADYSVAMKMLANRRGSINT